MRPEHQAGELLLKQHADDVQQAGEVTLDFQTGGSLIGCGSARQGAGESRWTEEYDTEVGGSPEYVSVGPYNERQGGDEQLPAGEQR